MIRFSVLASGSRGNAIYVEAENTRILIDAGLSGREIEHRLELVGVDPADLNFLIITHEHSDHIKGAGPLARRFDLPLYITRKTFENSQKKLGKLPPPVFMESGQSLCLGLLTIEPFTKCHDAADPVGILLSSNGTRMGVVTDLGRSTRLVEDRLKGCHALVIEFNHDPEMLDSGPYPLHLKQRIKSNDGHLSNQQGAELLASVCHSHLKQVVLAHLSEANNHPDKACQEAAQTLEKMGFGTTTITVSTQDEPGPMIEIP